MQQTHRLGSRSGGVQIGWGGTGKGFVVEYIFLYWRYVGEKFSQIFSNFLEGGGGCQIGGVVEYIFSIGIFWGFFFLKFSQIFSEYIFMYWHSGKIFSNFLKIVS